MFKGTCLKGRSNCPFYYVYGQLLRPSKYVPLNIFSDNPPKEKIDFKDKYDLKLFDYVNNMVNAIKNKNLIYVEILLDLLAHEKTKEEIKKAGSYDIVIGKYRYMWNTTREGFIYSQDSINEIGSIHTSQGCDLNYAGIIIGNDLKYACINHKLYIDKKNYYDSLGKQSLQNDEELKEYIIRVYKILMTRGIRGTFIYACDDGLRMYLRQFLKSK